jgi:hypothetical protein
VCGTWLGGSAAVRQCAAVREKDTLKGSSVRPRGSAVISHRVSSIREAQEGKKKTEKDDPRMGGQQWRNTLRYA